MKYDHIGLAETGRNQTSIKDEYISPQITYVHFMIQKIDTIT